MGTLEKNEYILILGYYPQRFFDVEKMIRYVKTNYGFKTVLISDEIARDHSRYSLKHLEIPYSDPHYLKKVFDFIGSIPGKCVGVFPFMDYTCQIGANIAAHFNLYGDSPELSSGGLSKLFYRSIENDLSHILTPQGIVIPKSMEVKSFEEWFDFFTSCHNAAVLKPIGERANRGVVVVLNEESAKNAWQETAPYHSSGMIAEEFVKMSEEYSVDGFGSLAFVTGKWSAQGQYPIEIGQVVPAEIPLSQWHHLMRVGTIVNLITGQKIGAFHNEIKYDRELKKAFVVESNRRPAGMSIWQLAKEVFDIDFIETWVDHILFGNAPVYLPAPKGRAAVRMLFPLENGILKENINSDSLLNNILFQFDSLYPKISRDLKWNNFKVKPSGSLAIKIAKENGQHLAEISVYTEKFDLNLKEITDSFEKIWQHEIEKHIIFES